MNERRESRIPRPSPPPRALSDRSNTVSSKRKASAMDAIDETKRSTRPARSVSAAPVASTCATPSLASVGAPAASGPASGEETFEDISARTGATVIGVLNKKMAFRKGMRPEKKVEEMVPMVKELRAVGWYLHNGKERVDLDCAQWKGACEELEREAEVQKTAWETKGAEIETQMKEIQVLLTEAEAGNVKLSQMMVKAETTVNEHSASLEAAQGQLKSVTAELEHTSKTLEEKCAKIKEMEDVMRHGQSYSSTLQNYNTSLQTDIKDEREKREDAAKHRDLLQGQLSEVSARVKGLEHNLQVEAEAAQKLRSEREGVTKELCVLRADLESTRQERDRLLVECTKAKDDLVRFRAAGGSALENLETLTNAKATLDVQLATQQRIIASMRQELADSKESAAMSGDLAGSRQSQVLELKAQVQELQEMNTAAGQKIYDNETVRRKLHNIIQELKGNIRVFCRVRPVSSVEQASAEHESEMALEFPESDDILRGGLVLNAPQRGGLESSGTAIARHNFTFDRVFGPSSSQENVFEEISELVQSALDGHKVCIFAYGQTGSGKTHTMLGNPEHPGMIPRAMHQIFDTSKQLSTQGWVFVMHASMLEIYNEEIKDLLGPKVPKLKPGQAPPTEKKHQVLHSADGATTVTELTTVDVSQPERVESLLAEAMEKRAVGCTALNEQSSRSHMVFSLRIEGTNSSTGKKVAGVLNLIDLAGSERVKESGATGVRLKEAQNINKSLAALGDVIAALGSKESHIPFRNSKLTYLLQPCLGGDAKTLMFVNVAPSREFAFESLCSLRFAAKVNACEINPRKQSKA